MGDSDPTTNWFNKKIPPGNKLNFRRWHLIANSNISFN